MEKLKKTTFRYLEDELFSYMDTLQEIKRLRDEIMYNNNNSDENTGGGRSSLPSDPTGQIATRLATHKKLNYLEGVTLTISKVYETLPELHKEFLRLKYWTKPQNLTIIGIAEKMSVSQSRCYQLREEIIQLLALEMGYR